MGHPQPSNAEHLYVNQKSYDMPCHAISDCAVILCCAVLCCDVMCSVMSSNASAKVIDNS